MGCLPVIFLFVIGAGVGWLLAGEAGALWGAGIGVGVGVLAGFAVLAALRHMRTGEDKP